MDSVCTLILVGQSWTLRKNKFEAVAQRIQLRFHLMTEEELQTTSASDEDSGDDIFR
jgi:hypothetical protein